MSRRSSGAPLLWISHSSTRVSAPRTSTMLEWVLAMSASGTPIRFAPALPACGPAPVVAVPAARTTDEHRRSSLAPRSAPDCRPSRSQVPAHGPLAPPVRTPARPDPCRSGSGPSPRTGLSFEYTTTAPTTASPSTPTTRAPEQHRQVPSAFVAYQRADERHSDGDHEEHHDHAVGELHHRVERQCRCDVAPRSTRASRRTRAPSR